MRKQFASITVRMADMLLLFHQWLHAGMKSCSFVKVGLHATVAADKENKLSISVKSFLCRNTLTEKLAEKCSWSTPVLAGWMNDWLLGCSCCYAGIGSSSFAFLRNGVCMCLMNVIRIPLLLLSPLHLSFSSFFPFPSLPSAPFQDDKLISAYISISLGRRHHILATNPSLTHTNSLSLFSLTNTCGVDCWCIRASMLFEQGCAVERRNSVLK